MVDERFHRLVDTTAWWWRHLLVLDSVVALRHLIENLMNHANRLSDLVESDRVPIERVAVRADDDVEVELLVVQVRDVATQVPRDARRTSGRDGRQLAR